MTYTDFDRPLSRGTGRIARINTLCSGSNMDDQPIYVSKPTVKSLWQEYRIFPDRLVLGLHLTGPITVPFDDIEGVSVRPAGVVFDLVRRDYGFAEIIRTLKLDLADLNEHVTIEHSTGHWRHFRITPEDPEEFVAALERALTAFNESRGKTP